MCLCAIMVNFRSGLQGCIACQGDQSKAVIFKANIKRYFTTDIPHLFVSHNQPKVLKRGAGEGWRRSVGPIM